GLVREEGASRDRERGLVLDGTPIAVEHLIVGQRAVGEGGRAAGVQQAAADAGGVAADGAVGQRGRAGVLQAAAPGGGVAADGAVGQGGGVGVGHTSAVVGGVAADGAVGQRGRARNVDQAASGAAVGGGVASDGAIGQRRRAPNVGQAAA